MTVHPSSRRDLRGSDHRHSNLPASPQTIRTPTKERLMSAASASNTTALTQLVKANDQTYAYRRFGGGPGLPLLLLQHFMGTLDNWDPAVTDALASVREVILLDNAGVGRSSGEVPPTIAGMAAHALAFLQAL